LNGYTTDIWPHDQVAELPITVTDVQQAVTYTDTWSADAIPDALRINFVSLHRTVRPGSSASMPEDRARQIRESLDVLYRRESGRIRATLIRVLGDFDLADDAVQDAFAAALQSWTRDGMPENPRAWLVSAGRFKAIDSLRRRARLDASQEAIAAQLEHAADLDIGLGEDGIEDDRLRLIFTCCHPALAPDARVALTLREVCGLTTEEIARALLIGAPTLGKRIVRAKARIREARIPYEVPSPSELPERLNTVLQVIYLVFNEGYSASSGASVTRSDLSGEAIRLGRLLTELITEPEVTGLVALMLLQESRRAARTSPTGDLILLEDQDRALWNRAAIAEGVALVERALASRRFGPYTLQAAIAALHAEAASAADTDWPQIVALYSVLLRADPSPVVELNRAVALAMRDGPEVGLQLIDGLLARGELANYHLAHSARADLCRRLGRIAEARASYERALVLTQQAAERRFLEHRLRTLED
jgi:RNA polymerase sigma-70 factor, ECF subfamily